MKIFFSLLFAGMATVSFSQKITLRGSVADSIEPSLPAATVALLHQKDSVMASFAMTDNDGKFVLRRVSPGDYLLQITYLGYQAHWQTVRVEADKPEQDLGKITLSAETVLLKSIEVLDEHSPIRISLDTMEYNAAAFKVKPSDVVEDLLRKLPGVEVQRDGTVKAHGETVKNVLVEGKEFFGKDTRIATKNLPADAVDKVQVFDKKSEMAEFTGIEDGQDERTINLKLKPGKKAGYFGKVDAGAGSEGRFAGKANVNRFSPTTQLSAIAMGNNTNEQGFSLNEYIDFMGGIGAFMSGGGGGRVEVNLGGDGDGGGLPIGDGNGVAGIQQSLAGGINLNHDFSKNTELTASYFFNRFENDLSRALRRDNFLDDGIFKNTENETRESRNLSHRFNFLFKHKIDSSQRFSIRMDAGLSDGFLRSRSHSGTFAPDGTAENTNLNDFSSDGINYNLRSTATWKKRFQRPGRAVVASASGRLANQENKGLLMSENTFFRLSSVADSIRQRQLSDDSGGEYGLNLAWTEPLGKRQYLKFDVSRQNFSNETGKDFFDITTNGELFNDLLSNRYRRDYTYDRGGLTYLLNRKKYNLTLAMAYQNSRLKGSVPDAADNFSVTFSRPLPSIFYEYEFKMANRLSLDYTTRLREPSLEQLQPVANNSDPLNIFKGNPNLQPEYIHDLRLGYFMYDQFTFTSLFASLNGSFVKDKITNAGSVDSLFRRTITPLNVANEWSVRGSLEFGTPIRPLKIATRIRLSSRLTQSILFVNELKNDVTRRRDALDFSIENRKKTKVDALVGVRLAHNRTNWSVAASQNRKYTDTEWYTDLSFSPTEKWLLDTKMEYTIYSAETFGERSAIPMWQAGLTRYILKDDKGRLRISVVNLLNQNLGIRRSSEFNYVEQETVNALGRYFMLSFGYSLAGFGKKSGGIEIDIGG